MIELVNDTALIFKLKNTIHKTIHKHTTNGARELKHMNIKYRISHKHSCIKLQCIVKKHLSD